MTLGEAANKAILAKVTDELKLRHGVRMEKSEVVSDEFDLGTQVGVCLVAWLAAWKGVHEKKLMVPRTARDHELAEFRRSLQDDIDELDLEEGNDEEPDDLRRDLADLPEPDMVEHTFTVHMAFPRKNGDELGEPVVTLEHGMEYVKGSD